MISEIQKKYIAIFLCLAISGCSSLQQHNIKGAGWYRVKPTDTLYSVAWRYGLDHQELATWNGLSEPFTIRPGQQLILIEPEQLPAQSPEIMDNSVQVVPVPGVAATVKTPLPASSGVKVKPISPSYNQVLRWQWPAKGKLVSQFSIKQMDKRGIDIAGEIGQPVYAVADGKVVYSGTGLAGYGNLIIVKHNDLFLSAYAYNKNRLVTEGMTIKQGTKIAEMGWSMVKGKQNLASLHFQIRKKGKPVNPLLYLPERNE